MAADAALAQAYTHCFDLLRDGDRELWLASLFWPEAVRPNAHAILAFGLEIARVREVVSEPALGEIRHQWWARGDRERRAGRKSRRHCAA